MTRALLILAAVLASTAGAAAPPVHLQLPYDLAASGSNVYVADGLRHQILRYDLAKRRLTVFAGTGATGTSGDGRPALRARLTEPTDIVRDRAGNLYFSDVNQGRVRRIDRRGVITTVARVVSAAGLSVDRTGRYLAIAAIEGYVYRLTLPSGPLERLAGNGTDASSGDGGPALDAAVNGPHDVGYDADGNLYIGNHSHVRRIDAATGTITTPFAHDGAKLVVAPDRTIYILSGDPNGGKITQVDATGRILISHALPVPAIRRLATGSSTLITLVR
jgi:SMP-30/Gluconolactonase/LRE-like region